MTEKPDREIVVLLVKEMYKYLYEKPNRFPHTKQELKAELDAVDRGNVYELRYFYLKAKHELPEDYINAVVNEGVRLPLGAYEQIKEEMEREAICGEA